MLFVLVVYRIGGVNSQTLAFSNAKMVL